MASTCSGLRRPTKPYISLRQVQKLSSPAPSSVPVCSVSPAMARWKAWLWRLGMPGMTGPAARKAAPGAWPSFTAAISPRGAKLDQHILGPALGQQRVRGEYRSQTHGTSRVAGACRSFGGTIGSKRQPYNSKGRRHVGRSLGERPARHHDGGRRPLWRDRRWRHRRRRRAHRLGRLAARPAGSAGKARPPCP